MSKARSIRLVEELEPLVDEMPRGGFSFIVNRLLQLYFSDDKIRESVDKVQFASQPEPEAPVDLPSIPDPAEAIRARQKAEVEAAEMPTAPVKAEEYNLLDSIVPR